MNRSRQSYLIVSVLALCAWMGLALAPCGAQTSPVPFLQQPVWPVGAVPGGAQFTLVATGTGFVRGSTLTWNGTRLTTTYVSGTRINASVPASYITASLGALVGVQQPGGLPASNGVTFEVGKSRTSVTLGRTDYAAGLDSVSVVTADFNGDGVPDLAAVSNSQSNFTILTGNGDGTFKVQGTFLIPSAPGYVAVADFNNDGKADLAISGLGVVYVFLGNGDGTFGGATDYTMQADDGPVAVGDFNGDGIVDIATTDPATGTVAVMVNGVATNYSVGSMPEGVTVGDFNHDGKLDLAVANYAGASLSILLGNGDGTFKTPSTITTTNGPWALVTADINNDAKLDLLVATPGYSQTENQMVVLVGNGDGTFKAPQGYSVGSDPLGIVAGDFNNDRKLDVAVAAEASNQVSLLLGNGDGTFQTSLSYAAAAGVDSLAAGDFNKDGSLDLAGSYYNSSSVSAFLQPSNGQAKAVVSPTSLTFPLTVVSYSSASMPVTLTNTGTANLSIQSITASAQFSANTNFQGGCQSSLSPGAFCTINVTFTPQHQGTQTGTLTISDNAQGSPQTVSLQGQATFFLVSPLSWDFGTVTWGTTSTPLQISIYGEDGQPEKVSFSISPSGDTSLFPYTNTCNGYVPSHAFCYVNISFAPVQGTGSVSANFQINGGGGLTKVAISGTGHQ